MKKIFLIILSVIVAVLIVALIKLNNLKPQYSGTIEIKGLDEQVIINYDEYGILHIQDKNARDAYFAGSQ